MATPEQRLVTEASILNYWPTGPGSPEGIVYAPTGTVYVDTANASAIDRAVWVKATPDTSATGWQLVFGYAQYDITSLATNVAGGTVWLVIDGTRAGVRLQSVKPGVAGTCEFFPSAGHLRDYSPEYLEYFAVANRTSGATRNIQRDPNGRVAVLSAATTDTLDGTMWWPRTRTLPATIIGTEVRV